MSMMLAVLVLFATCVAFFLAARLWRRKDHPLHHAANIARLAACVFVALAGLLLANHTLVIVQPGTRGVVVSLGRVAPHELGEGLHIVAPWSDVEKFDVRIRKSDEKQIAETSDTQSVTIQTILNWRIQADQVVDLYSKIGPDVHPGGLEDRIITPAVYEVVKAEVARHKVTDLIALRHEMKEAVQTKLCAWLEKYHIELTEVAMADVDFSEQYDRAIESKQVEEQRAMQAQYELTRKKTEAEMTSAEAHGRAESAIEQARGAAESVKLAAQAEADALGIRGDAQAGFNRKVAESLSGALLQKLWMDRWDGRLPHLLTAGGPSPTLMLNPFELPPATPAPAAPGKPDS